MARRDGWDPRHSRPHVTDYMSVHRVGEATAAVRDAQGEAAGFLESLGWKVTPPPDQPVANLDRLREF